MLPSNRCRTTETRAACENRRDALICRAPRATGVTAVGKARPYLGRQVPGSHLALGCYVISVLWRVGSVAGSRSSVVGAGAPTQGPVSDSTCPMPK